jgi:APA family basic amino acid/polyamine antiporter
MISVSELKKDLELTDLVLLGIGHVIGAGIFVILSKIIYFGGNKTYYAIFLMCILSIIIYFCYLEIKNRYNTLINEYFAIKDNLGTYIGNISLYIIYFISIFSVVTITIAISKYVLKYKFLGQNSLHDTTFNHIICSIILLCIMSIINYFGIAMSKMFINIIGILLLLILGFIIIVCIPKININSVISKKFEPISYNHFVLATILSLFLYNGYDAIIKLKEETKNNDDVYKSIIITIIISTVIFLLLVMISLSIFGRRESGNTYHLLVNLYENFFQHHIGETMTYIVGIIIMFNTAFIALISSSRFLYHCGRHNEILFSKYVGEVNTHQSPYISIIISFILCVILVLGNNEVMSAIFTNFSVLIILYLL